MQLIQGNPDAKKEKSFSVEERSFTLSPRAFAILRHFTGLYQTTYDETLDALLLTIDALSLDLGLNDKQVTVNETGTNYSFQPKSIITTPELRTV